MSLPRRSTLVLLGVFLAELAAYLLVRPGPGLPQGRPAPAAPATVAPTPEPSRSLPPP